MFTVVAHAVVAPLVPASAQHHVHAALTCRLFVYCRPSLMIS